ncbi:MAG TPA: tRNA uracil 4-sulfurtransferase ThiI [Terriglobia bacterium]|nr:tRNA uracil 4-sulfurtransferase ThiI [Terriglobia bacterium]
MQHVLILHYHEIWLKGGNKNYFLSRLIDAIKRSLADLPLQSLQFVADRLVLYARDEAALPQILDRLRRVFGLAYIASARVVPNDVASMGAVACELMAEKDPRNFAVRAKIADSEFGMNSMEVERALGRLVLDHLRARRADVQVRLNDPEVTCWVEILPGQAFIYTDRPEGAGGLPAVTAGRLVAMLSGGFDSAVAAYKMMRRGAHLTFVHFASTGSPARGPSHPVAEQLVRVLTPYQFTSRLYTIPFESIQRQVVVNAEERIRLLLYRRLMARITREISGVERALGLVTGDSVSQVASQTLHNLASIEHGLDIPLYRPLAGDDKEEILRVAREIGTYSISCEPFEDCCPRFMPRAPAIFSKPAELGAAEAKLDVEALVSQGLEGAVVRNFTFEAGEITVREELPRRLQNLIAQRKLRVTPAPVAPPVPAEM